MSIRIESLKLVFYCDFGHDVKAFGLFTIAMAPAFVYNLLRCLGS